LLVGRNKADRCCARSALLEAAFLYKPETQSGLNTQHNCQRFGDFLHRCVGKFPQSPDKPFLCHRAYLKSVCCRGLVQAVLRVGFQPNQPRRYSIAIFPIGNGNNHLQRQNPDGVIIYDDRGTRVFLISAPIVGSRLMSQTSPRRIKVLAVESREDGQFAVRCIIR
jgi:hypothetical protein